MRETAKTRIQLKAMVMTVAAMMMIMLVFGLTTIISHAEDARVTVRSVVIRSGADVGTEMVGGAQQGETLPITGETMGADGYTWYQVTFEGGTKTGYVRSDLVEKVSGGAATTPTTPTTTTPASTPSTDVVAVQPVSAKVTGEAVRVRANASTSGDIVDTVRRDVALTVLGTAQDSENMTWYQVSFTNASGQITGFVRKDFVTLEGELIPADQVPAEPATPEITDPVAPEPDPTPEPVKTGYETQLLEDGWNLLDYTGEEGKRYVISELFSSIEKYRKEAEESTARLKSTKIIMIILVVAVILLALTSTLLFFKIRDMMDAAYFEEVEQETVRKRQGQRSAGKASMPTVGDGTRSAGGGQARSSGGGQARSSGSGQARPAGSGQARPAGGGQARSTGNGQQSRPAGSGQARPAGSGQARPNGQGRPTGSGQQAKTAGGQGKPAQQAARPAAHQQERPASREGQNTSGQSRNFLEDDDEFDFEYLNWDGEEEN